MVWGISMGYSSKIWDNLFLSGEFIWKEPHELVTGFLPSLERIGVKWVLDLGCGAGRHLVFLSGHGFTCHGTDIAFAGLESAKKWLVSVGFAVRLSQSEMHLLPYASCSFDAVVCLFVVYHGTVDKIITALNEIYRVMRPGGLSLLTFISDQHHRRGKGEEIESNTFITNIGADAGIPHHFCNEDEIVRMVKAFKILRLELLGRINEEGLLESHWAVLLEKARSA
jgi:SAM-dependent methyltransferase